MNKFVRGLLLSCLLLTGLIGNAVAQLTSTGVELAAEYDTLAAPSVGGTYVDSTFGSTIKRVSNALRHA